MHDTTRDILGEASYMKRACEILLDRLAEVEQMVDGSEQLTPMQAAEIANAYARSGVSAKDQIEMATRYVADWRGRINEVLAMQPPKPEW